jgi:peptidoglycan/xylan/chitin deacetylase (PgdA/CDA1 family)
MAQRDFLGYGGAPPHPRWPNDARIAVSFVVNFEEGAELTVSGGDAKNESAYEVTAEVVGAPDLCMESHFEYATRAGYWRVMEAFDRYGVKATVSACGRAVEVSPWLAKDAAARGHEVSCHGWRWIPHCHLREDEERTAIASTVAAIARATGVRPVGWHTRSAPSANTRRLLVEEGGFLYDSDAYNDDLPYFVDVAGRRHLVIPYAFDTNDMRFQAGAERFKLGDDFARYVADAFDRLWSEGARAPRMMSVGLHLRTMGRPGRIGGLERVLRHMGEQGGVWFARRRDIAEHWIARFGAAG